MTEPKDIILNAIRVLRSRRVRPSNAKIAWYARREYLQSEELTEKTLGELVTTGDIVEVFYKGGNSFRVASHRHKSTTSKLMSSRRTHKLSGLQTSAEVIRPVLNAIAACGSSATKDRIAEKLIEADQIGLVERLDVLLQKESRVGIIGRKTVFIKGRTLPAYFLTRSSSFSILNKSLDSSCTSPKRDTSKPPSNNVSPLPTNSPKRIGPPAPFEHLQESIKRMQQEKEGKDSDTSGCPSPEENIHMNSEDSSIDKTISQDDTLSQETEYQRLLDEDDYSSKTTPAGNTRKSSAISRRGRPRKPTAIFDPDSGGLMSSLVSPVTSSVKRGRPPKGPNSANKTKPMGSKKSRKSVDTKNGFGDPCNTCGQPGSPLDQLLICQRCPIKAHPVCLGYSAELADKSRLGPWTCMDCKLCEICYMDHTVGTLIFCDECDRAFHLTCHQPSLDEQPQGSWVCFICSPNDGPNVYAYLQNSLTTPRESHIFEDESRGSTGSWDHQKGFDPKIPNAYSWDIEKVIDYFNEKGFEEYSNSFKEHEIDGTALLMLTRIDVLTGLGLLLGPALHIYKEIKILQTRNPNPPLP